MTDIWLPNFERVKGTVTGATPRRPDAPPRCVLHTDEVGAHTRRLAETHQNPPQLWVNPKTKERYQIIPLNRTGQALRRDTALETNHMGRCVQVEIAGWAKDTHQWPQAWHDWLALEVMLPIHEHAGIPLTTWEPYRGGEGYGVGASQRMSPEQWTRFTGFCGHQHVPGNSHWDPGKLPVAAMLATIQAHKKPVPPIITLAEEPADVWPIFIPERSPDIEGAPHGRTAGWIVQKGATRLIAINGAPEVPIVGTIVAVNEVTGTVVTQTSNDYPTYELGNVR